MEACAPECTWGVCLWVGVGVPPLEEIDPFSFWASGVAVRVCSCTGRSHILIRTPGVRGLGWCLLCSDPEGGRVALGL